MEAASLWLGGEVVWCGRSGCPLALFAVADTDRRRLSVHETYAYLPWQYGIGPGDALPSRSVTMPAMYCVQCALALPECTMAHFESVRLTMAIVSLEEAGAFGGAAPAETRFDTAYGAEYDLGAAAAEAAEAAEALGAALWAATERERPPPRRARRQRRAARGPGPAAAAAPAGIHREGLRRGPAREPPRQRVRDVRLPGVRRVDRRRRLGRRARRRPAPAAQAHAQAAQDYIVVGPFRI
jgi:hypothetical protein